MPTRSKVAKLPAPVRAWLDKALIEGGFSDYVLLEKLLTEKGFSIGKSTLQRHGDKLQRRLDAIKASTDAALLINEHAGDKEANLSGAVLALTQTSLFDLMVGLQDIEDAKPEERAKLLQRVAHAAADLTRASLSQKKFQTEVRTRAEAAAEEVTKIAKTGGLSGDTVELIRAQILGIAK